MDFLVREGRECVEGDMYMIRFGSCGCLTDLVSTSSSFCLLILTSLLSGMVSKPVGSIVAPKASVAVTRNLDFDFSTDPDNKTHLDAYRVSKPVRMRTVCSMRSTLYPNVAPVLGLLG